MYRNGGAKDLLRPANDGFTPMLAACEENNLEIVKWIYEQERRDKGGSNESGSESEVCESVTQADHEGWTPMYVACQVGCLELVQWLYDHDAETDIIKRINNGQTPLDIAKLKSNLEVVDWLIEHNGHIIPHSYYYHHNN